MNNSLLLNELHRQAGAIIEERLGWRVPVRFGDVQAEYRAVREQAGLIDWSIHGVIEVRGADRAAFLHNLLTNDIKALSPGASTQACLATPTAKLLADLVVLADREAHWLLVDLGRLDPVIATLTHYLITEDVTLTDRSAHFICLAIQGPRSEALLHTLGISAVLARLGGHQLVTVEEIPVRFITWSITGSPGVLLLVQAEHAARLWETVRGRGRAVEVMPVGWEALETLRLEAGLPWYGIDMDDTCLVPETGLEETAVSVTKGCYVGQEVMARLQTYGSVSRKLVGLVCEGDSCPQAADPILNAAEVVGQLTSACWSPALKHPIAMGYVKRPHYEAGTRVEILHNGKPVPATLVKRPFLQHG